MSVKTAAEQNVAFLLADAVGKQRSGIITATRGKLKRLFCLDRGSIVHVASNLVEEQFDEQLVRNKVLAPGQRVQAKLEAQKHGRSLFEELVASKIIDTEVLHEALGSHAAELVRASLDFEENGCGFEPGKPNLDGRPAVMLSAVELVLEHAREHPRSLDAVRVRIGPPDLRAGITSAAKDLLAGLTLDAATGYLATRADGTLEVAALVEDSPAPPEETLRALMALLALRILEGVVTDQPEDDSPGGLTRDECLARVHRSEEATHYDILGLDTSADEDAIRSAYYLLARRYHPDRFRTGPLTGLLAQMEDYFTKVTEAYNTLHDREMREYYDGELARGAGKKTQEPEQDTAYLARQNYARGRELMERGRFADAVTFLENALQLAEGEAPYHLALGQVLVRNPRRRADAVRHLERAIELDPTSVAAKLDLGRLLRRMKQDDRAESLFREVLQWEPNNVEAAEELKAMGRPAGGRGGIFKG